MIALTTLVFRMMQSSDAYQEALVKARSSQAVVEALGTPIEDGYYVRGSIRVDGSDGSANLSFPIHGPKGKGHVTLKAVKSMGDWTFEQLSVKINATGNRIDLLAETAE